LGKVVILEEGAIEGFLSERGFEQIKDISGDYYESEYFKGPNSNRKGCCLCTVVSATVKPENDTKDAEGKLP
jgi:hypothetical protein